MQRQRVISLIDGLNLYHAISNLGRPELFWTDLRALSRVFLKTYSEELIQVFYFSAYADHIEISKQKSQESYLKAIELKGVRPVLGYFKKRTRNVQTVITNGSVMKRKKRM